jgi:hypothetical protein
MQGQRGPLSREIRDPLSRAEDPSSMHAAGVVLLLGITMALAIFGLYVALPS